MFLVNYLYLRKGKRLFTFFNKKYDCDIRNKKIKKMRKDIFVLEQRTGSH